MKPVTSHQSHALFDVASTRRVEQAAAAALPAHTLMQRAGLSVAQLALALRPHAQRVWVACGPGNNGGDGLEAAMHLKQWGKAVAVTLSAPEQAIKGDALLSLRRAQSVGVSFVNEPPQLDAQDLCVDALLGIGSSRAPSEAIAHWVGLLNRSAAAVLAVDTPTGLCADTGALFDKDDVQTPPRIAAAVHAIATLSLLTLKPGLFTGHGRDVSGRVWFDDLGVPLAAHSPNVWLAGPPTPFVRRHASHKGSYGDLVVLGGAAGMVGAALLAGRAALGSGAGRVFLELLSAAPFAVDPGAPDLMVRPLGSLDYAATTVVCGCGGGDPVRSQLPRVLSTSQRLVLDADALNAIATDAQLQTQLTARAQRRGRVTVLTPHPKEAARLLGTSVADVQSNALAAAQQLAERFACVVVLKGSGSVIAGSGQTPAINPTGNARLAVAGTGDVLAGMIGAHLACGTPAFDAACAAVWLHGKIADDWPAARALTADALSRAVV